MKTVPLAALAMLALAGCSAAPSASGGLAAATASPSPTTCAGIVTAWKDGTMGWTYFKEVQRELGEIGPAAAAGELVAFEQDGANLQASALFAEHHPVPSCADPSGSYTRAMRFYKIAGGDASHGRVRATTAMLRRANTALGRAAANIGAVAG